MAELSRAKKEKQKQVEALAERIKAAGVVALADLRALPDRHLQSLRKRLRGTVEISVLKNSIIAMAIERAGKGKELIGHLKGPSALITTNINPFTLYKQIKQGKGRAAAKPGQVAPYDIVVPAGETSLAPGPVLTELKQAGVNAQIKGGKVVIAADSVVAKAGSKITNAAAKALQKLGVMPFEVRARLPVAWEAGITYPESVLDVDEKKFMADLAGAASAAFNLSVFMAYPTKNNIALLIGKGAVQAMALAVNANIYEKEVIGLLLAKGSAHAGALASRAKPTVNEVK